MNVGVLGCGYLGSRHAGRLRQRPDVERLVLYDRITDRSARLAAELGAEAAGSADQLLESCEAVVVAASTTAHEDLTRRAFAAGCHVLVEKPIASSLEEADRMIDAARATHRVLMVGQVERYNPVVRALADRPETFSAQGGDDRRPRFIEAHRLAAFQPRSLDIDVVLDLMIHDIDLALHLVRELPFRIDAAGSPVLTNRVDIANARLVFPGGCVANLTASRVSIVRTRKFRVFMPRTYLSLDLAEGRGEKYTLRPAGEDGAGEAGAADFGARVGHESLEGAAGDALGAEQDAFLRAAAGQAAAVVGGEEGRAALAVALQVTERLAERGL